MPKVIVVDDSATVRAQVGGALSKSGFEVLEARDGLEALDKVSATPDLSLVVCDVNMPRMNGLEFLEAARAKGIHVPVLMLTTEGQPQLMQRAKAAGAKAWIIKPFKADILVAAVKKLAVSNA